MTISKILLAGNPNCGKTTLFNKLTGARQRIANYPGVTVEAKVGSTKLAGHSVEVVDLPGTYSMTTFAPDEEAARKEISALEDGVIINVVDISNLERQLFLTCEILSQNKPMILVLNMSDVAEKNGLFLHAERLASLLGIPVLRTIASKGVGVKELKELLISYFDGEKKLVVDQDEELGVSFGHSETLLKQAHKLADEIKNIKGSSIEEYYDITSRIDKMCVEHDKAIGRYALSDKIDAIALHPFFGPIILVLIMVAVFYCTFSLGGVLQEWIEHGVELFSKFISSKWTEKSALHDLIIDGIIGGVGAVLSFLPNILVLFAGVAILENSGYMARIVYMTDKWMRRVGLHGKSIMPLLSGFGCTVPAIIAARTLENKQDRIVTILISPLMSCGARLPIYVMIIPVFFAKTWMQVSLMVLIYFIGIILALICAFVLRKGVFKAETAPLIMELPPYHLPVISSICLHTWEKASEYLKKAGTLIFAMTVILWVTDTYPKKEIFSKDYDTQITQLETQIEKLEAQGATTKETIEELIKQKRNLKYELRREESNFTYSGRIGKALTPVMKPLDFDDRIAVALIGAFAAKEVLVSQMAVSFAVDEEDEAGWQEQLRKGYTPLQAFCIMLFCLISMPCVSTFVIAAKELRSLPLAIGQLVGLTILAWIITYFVNLIGKMIC